MAQEGAEGVSLGCRGVGEGGVPRLEGAGLALEQLWAQAVGLEVKEALVPSLSPSAEESSHASPLQIGILMFPVSPLNDYRALLHWSEAS